MKLSTKGRYGLRAMIDLARYSEKEPVSLSSIAERQYLSEGYLEQLVAMLKKAGLVAGIRGAQGGYVLAKDPSDISVGDILRALGRQSGTGKMRGLLFRRGLPGCRRLCDKICLAEDQRQHQRYRKPYHAGRAGAGKQKG